MWKINHSREEWLIFFIYLIRNIINQILAKCVYYELNMAFITFLFSGMQTPFALSTLSGWRQRDRLGFCAAFTILCPKCTAVEQTNNTAVISKYQINGINLISTVFGATIRKKHNQIYIYSIERWHTFLSSFLSRFIRKAAESLLLLRVKSRGAWVVLEMLCVEHRKRSYDRGSKFCFVCERTHCCIIAHS